LKTIRFGFLLIVLASTVMGCQLDVERTETLSSPAITENVTWPTDGWETVAPELVGLDPAALAEMLDWVDSPQGEGIHSILVIRYGKIAAEAYGAGYGQAVPHPVYSCTKSVTSMLVGIAIEEGLITGVDQPVLSYFSEDAFANQGPKKDAMTLEDVLTMRAGLAWQEGMPAYQALYRSQDWIQNMLDRPMVDQPGTIFDYCSGCSHLLTGVLENVTDGALLDYAQAKLFDQLGIEHVSWEVDASGIPIGGWGLSLTPREMAKLGYLYLHEGRWEGFQVVPSAWVARSTESIVPVGGPWGYGYQWWTFPIYNLFAARGMGGQEIYVLPEQDMVVVFTADLEDTGVLFDILENQILPAVQSE
jgi:CubicO group peptidase (beta-lactamase class C family)